MNLSDRFYISKYPTVKTESDCFEWQGAKNKAGYGLIYFNKSQVLAHRFLYQLLNPTIDITGKVILHMCDNPLCVNPDHLKLGTQQENIVDCSLKGRWGAPRYSKLTKEQAIEIKYSLLPNRVFVEKYNVTKQLISEIRNNKIWKGI